MSCEIRLKADWCGKRQKALGLDLEVLKVLDAKVVVLIVGNIG
ncbi:hypothetical protein QZK48_16195 [Acinetobacter baumannii]|nr:hypothetical protein [Acinetobacter baumannii]